MKKIVPLIIAVFFNFQLASSQDIELSPTVIASAGNYSEAGGISLSWTLGEVAVSTLKQGDIVLTQGFQQSFLNEVGFGLNPIKWQIAAYPNPVVDKLRIQFDMPETRDFIIEIRDIQGRLISQQQQLQVLPGNVITFEMGAFNYGVYLFRISTTDRQQSRVLSITKL
ncbi:MAG: T9SS type A sorting domain-containing protein [Bacteroidales bacterium]